MTVSEDFTTLTQKVEEADRDIKTAVKKDADELKAMVRRASRNAS